MSLYCHNTDTTWNPRSLPAAWDDIAENYPAMPSSRYVADGWRVAVPAIPPTGERIVESRVVFSDYEARQVIVRTVNIAAEDAAEAAAFAISEAVRKNTPVVYDQPIEVPSVVLPAHDALTPSWGYVPDADGVLCPYVYHASPIPSPEEIRARKNAAVAARKARVEKARAAKAAAASANSVPALREQVRALAELIEGL